MAASKHTHTRAQCSHASVGLAQARPNDSSIRPLLLVHCTLTQHYLGTHCKESAPGTH